ncbi:MAG: DNA-3-methyladenine glycosylase I [Flavobacteriales bacterium]
MNRCSWCGTDPIYVKYHDELWGVPVYDDKDLFAKLILDGAQAGLSWITILKKWEGYYRAFDGLNPDIMAKYEEEKIQELILDSGIVRNKLKIRAAITNAQAYLKIVEEEGSFSDYLWSFVGGKPITNSLKDMSEAPATSPESDAMSKDLKKRGFKFVGSTICYAFMQAVGMVNDHFTDCFRYEEVKKLSL